MAGIVNIDPDELEKFAHELSAFSKQLEESSKRLDGQFKRLGETWKDPQYAKFAQQFTQTMGNLRRFQSSNEKVVPRLLQTVKAARELLSKSRGVGG